MASVRIGVSGWRYKPWRGVFYPPDLPQRAELEYASRHFNALELNGSFYSLQRPRSYASWYAATPADFVFAVKGPRYLTHMLKLRRFEAPLANFLASGLLRLEHKLGPLLWQLPPQLGFDPARLQPFLRALPRNTAQALELARQHDRWMKSRVYLEIDAVRPVRHAIEVRHESFCTPAFIELLRRERIALVIAETARRWPLIENITADFVYVRLHGDEELYRSGYGDAALTRWAARIRSWHAGRVPRDARHLVPQAPPRARSRDVYCFFDNTDVKLRAPIDAQALMAKLGVHLETRGPARRQLPRRQLARRRSGRSASRPHPAAP